MGINESIKDMKHGYRIDGERIETMAQATEAAEIATKATGELHVPADRGDYVSPRYVVVEAPKVGAPVSYSFNGDSYPCGTITKVSASLKRVETSTGEVFFRRKLTGTWLRGGTWAMISGHVDERNPSF